ncbi:MAG: arginine--tRNA ligase [Alphaproteobacteria bacterium]|nr:arginine--tRNA ligase [Alphaproteobacteria bacterium]
MNYFGYLRDIVKNEIEAATGCGELPTGLDLGALAVTQPPEVAHADAASNAALVLARQAKQAPREIAALLAERLARHPDIVAATTAGPGFINLRLSDAFWRDRLREVLAAGVRYGDSRLGGGAEVNVEYVSANPTGPLHVGHGRGAVFGDALAALLEKAGYAVTREYYINDAGEQMRVLADSLFHRYREAMGEQPGPVPERSYPGEYLIPVAAKIAEESRAPGGTDWRTKKREEWREFFANRGVAEMMDAIKADLGALGIRHDTFFSERDLQRPDHDTSEVAETVKQLMRQGDIYTGVLAPPKGMTVDDWEPRQQALFRATRFGDDIDRPLQKSSGEWTYFASDIAYHRDKFRRGFRTMIDVWGADHGGYVKRMKAAVAAITGGQGDLDVKICQLVNVLKDGQPVRMSKRAGDFIALRAVVDEVGKDVVRFIMLTRRNDAPLDFDLARVVEQSRENPVFYVQYAHARACSVRRHAREAFPDLDLGPTALPAADLTLLADADEIGLIKRLAYWPELVESAAVAHEPHRITFYLHDVAAAFHALWNKGTGDAALRFIVAEQRSLTLARLALVVGVASVVASGLAVIGVTPLEELR